MGIKPLQKWGNPIYIRAMICSERKHEQTGAKTWRRLQAGSGVAWLTWRYTGHWFNPRKSWKTLQPIFLCSVAEALPPFTGSLVWSSQPRCAIAADSILARRVHRCISVTSIFSMNPQMSGLVVVPWHHISCMFALTFFTFCRRICRNDES